MTDIQNQPGDTIVDVQVGGPGNPWQIAAIGVESALTAPTGGGQGVESRYGRSPDGSFEFKSTVKSGNPDRLTASLNVPLQLELFIDQVQLMNCPMGIRTRHKCGDIRDITNFKAALSLVDCYKTSGTYSANLANYSEQTPDRLERQIDFSAAVEVAIKPVTMLDISGTKSDAAINKVIGVSVGSCAGDCGDEVTNEDEWWFITDKDSTPGYLGTATAKFGYSTDKGSTITWRDIDIFDGADGTDIAKNGNLVVVVSPTKGVATASVEDAKSDSSPV